MMTVAGKVECTSATTGFTVSQEYPILGFGYNSDGNYVVAITVNDNGDVVPTADLAGASFAVTELYASGKVV